MKTKELAIDKRTTEQGKTYWVVSKFSGNIEILPNMFSEIWRTISPMFATKQEAQKWREENKDGEF